MTKQHQKKNVVSGEASQSAWVVFCAETDIRWLKILKKGFRHCYVLLNDGQRWFSLDPLASCTDIQIYHHIEAAFDLPQWLEDKGFQVVPAVMKKDHKVAAPCMPFTCVESIKRVLGIHRRFIFTPWQLYQFLKNHHKNNNLFIIQKEIFHGRNK